MPAWKKVITSGSSAEFKDISATADLTSSLFHLDTTNITASGNISSSLTGSFAKLGINIESPDHELHVKGTGEVVTRLQSGNYWFDMNVNGSGNAAFQNGSGGDITFWDDQVAMMVMSDAKIGIGTSSPATKLEILNGATNQLRLSYDATHYTNMYCQSAGYLNIDNSHDRIYFGTDNDIYLQGDGNIFNVLG